VNQDMSTDSSTSPADVPDPDPVADPVTDHVDATPEADAVADAVASSPDLEAAAEEAAALDTQSEPVVEEALSSSDLVEEAPSADSEPASAAEVVETPEAAVTPEHAVEAVVADPAPADSAGEVAPAAEAAVPAEAAAVEAEPVEAEPVGPPAEPAAEEPTAAVAADAPKPGPRPSPAALAGLTRPAPPRPVAADAAPDAAPAATPVEDPDAPPRPTDSETFGRVDDDGTVHVRTPDGEEHPVGQWAAGTPEEGLAFFVRKYDDLSVEVDLATRRVTEGKAAPEQAAAVVKRARESLASPSMVGDLASLTARVDALDALVTEKRTAAAEARAAAKAAALAAREAIVAEAEALAESTQWKATGERFKTLLDDWKAAPRADRAGEQALWKRFSHARSQFDKHRRQYFARLDGERGEAKQVKEALVAEAESLQGSTDWGATAGAYRDLMSRWKASGRAGKADEEALWTRFRAAQDAFFAARNAALGQRDAGFAENLAAKDALLVEAEAIDTNDLKGAKAALRSIQERWEKIGHVPRGDKERIEGRLRKVEDAVRHGEQDQWRRSNPETKARANATVEQFSASLEKLEKQHTAAVAAGDTRKATDLEGRITTAKALLDAAEKAAVEFS
jgi:hypothetical protein